VASAKSCESTGLGVYWRYIPEDKEVSQLETAKLFMNGRSQAVRLPKQFRFEGSQVFIKRIGDAVVLLPYNESWQTLFSSLDRFTDDFMETRDQPELQQREALFE